MKRYVLSLVLLAGMAFGGSYKQIDAIINSSISDHIFPGASVIVGTGDSILYHKAYGRFTYDSGSTETDTLSIFDLASCTKVFATSMCMMKCLDSGLVSDEDYVKDFVSEFNNNGKGVIKVKHLLTHSSGLPAYTSPQSTPQATLNSIYNISMSQSLGTYTYSCLNFIMVMRVVEEATGMPMWQFYKQIYTDPMGLKRTLFCPSDSLEEDCLPTALSLQGSVHDPLAAGLDGLSGNAGLFSTTGDLAKFCQMMIHGGTLDGHTFVDSASTVKFTTLQSAGGSRAYGWGINGSSAGSLMSDLNYGHTGYTGTSAFIDPVREFFVVLLTNRVYPDDATSVSATRRKVADAAVRAYDDLAGQPRLHTVLPNSDGSWQITWDFTSSIDSIIINLENGRDMMYYATYPADSLTFTLPAADIPPNTPCEIQLVPVYKGETGNPSDTYPFMEKNKIALIVDGYDRVSNDYGWSLSYHAIAEYHSLALPADWGYIACDNQAVIEGDVTMHDYDCVLWFCGDESTSDETFSSEEQSKVRDYLESGGHLFVSGSEIGYDLSAQGNSADRAFYGSYLKASYAGDDSNDLSVYGRSETLFEDLSFDYGGSSALYKEDYPDQLGRTPTSEIILHYSKYKYAGVAYIGPFGSSQDTGKVVTIGFPFETIEGAAERAAFMAKIIQLFEAEFEVSVQDIFGGAQAEYRLHPAFPNPFNPETRISFDLPSAGEIKLSIYDVSGRLVDTPVSGYYAAGHHSVEWNAGSRASGIYICRLSSTAGARTVKFILMK